MDKFYVFCIILMILSSDAGLIWLMSVQTKDILEAIEEFKEQHRVFWIKHICGKETLSSYEEIIREEYAKLVKEERT